MFIHTRKFVIESKQNFSGWGQGHQIYIDQRHYIFSLKLDIIDEPAQVFKLQNIIKEKLPKILEELVEKAPKIR